MSDLRYKLEVENTHIKGVKVSSEIERMGPEMLPMGNSVWNAENWDDNYKSRKLMRAIGDKKKLGFFTVHNNQNDYWYRKFKSADVIDEVIVKVLGNGFTKKNRLYNVKVIPMSHILMPVGATWFCVGYTLQFESSDIDEAWTLSD